MAQQVALWDPRLRNKAYIPKNPFFWFTVDLSLMSNYLIKHAHNALVTCAKLDALGLVLRQLIVLHHLLHHPTGRSTSADLLVMPSANSWHWAGYERCSVNPCG
jgi:hypothetical protein